MRVLPLFLSLSLATAAVFETPRGALLPACASLKLRLKKRLIVEATGQCARAVRAAGGAPLSLGRPRLNENWALDRVNQNSAVLDGHAFQFGGSNAHPIYVIDGALLGTHTELRGRASTIASLAEPGGSCSHATSVVSMIAGANVGLWPHGQVFHVDAFGCSEETSGDTIVSAIAAVRDHRSDHSTRARTAVVNLSFGTPRSEALNAIFDDVAEEDDLVFVTSAGNSAADACLQSPASAARVITVASIDRGTDELSAFSNFGACVDVLAPGDKVMVASGASSGSYNIASGTSFAAPIVSAVVAGYLQVTGEDVTPESFRSAESLTSPGAAPHNSTVNAVISTRFAPTPAPTSAQPVASVPAAAPLRGPRWFFLVCVQALLVI